MTEDEKFWVEAMQNVVPLKPSDKIKTNPPKTIPKKIKSPEEEQPVSQVFYDNDVEQPESIFFARTGLQYRLQHELRQGKIRPQATLDLHGYTVDEARVAVSKFLTQALQQHLRVVKIIHGKGAASGAILRNKVYQWLPQSHPVLAFCSTIQSDGGTGAVYVLLRTKHF